MIFVTGDVHDSAMGGRDQAWLARHGARSEIDCAEAFARLAAEAGVPVTLFLTGLCARESPGAVARLAAVPGVAVGGHTWNGLRPTWRHALRHRFTGSFYGSREAQARDVARTLGALREATQGSIRAWRTHAFFGDAITRSVLAGTDVAVVSDAVDARGRIERIASGLVSVPINTDVDHDTMAHGDLRPDVLAGEQALRDHPWRAARPPWRRGHLAQAAREVARRALGVPRRPIVIARAAPDAWWNGVRRQVDDRLLSAGFATLLLHPACLEIAGGAGLMRAMLRDLAGLPCRPLGDAATFVPHGR
ncbi:MAG: hypothetical protein EXQ94_03390 [Alphaproteobacteria bacterium]|nr:hypothetical protein [Alphaproteobacteria bacterium]